MPDLTADYLALRRDVGAVRLARDLLRVSGPDAVTFLHGQLSQDVAGMGAGESRLSWLLQPDGKAVALLRVTRTGDRELLLDTDGGAGPAVLARLGRFRIRVKAELEPLSWHCLALRGPRAAEAAATVGRGVGDGTLALPAGWPGLDGVDLLGPEPPEVPEGVRLCDPAAYEAVRIEAGVPVVGREIVEGTIPNELGRDLLVRSASFTKGCYTGYELVERIDSRGGNVPRRLAGVVVAASVIPPAGATLRDPGGKDVGAITSVAESLDRRAPVALAFVRRGVEFPADVAVAWDGGEAPARVEELPLV